MHLTTTNPVPGVWRQNTRAGVILAISFTRLSRRNARISALRCECAHMLAFPRMRCECAHMRAFPRMRCECAHMLAFPRMRCECAHFCACDANARISRMLCECSHMRAFLRMRCDGMRCECAHAMRCECAHQGGTYACPVLYARTDRSQNTTPSSHYNLTNCAFHRRRFYN